MSTDATQAAASAGTGPAARLHGTLRQDRVMAIIRYPAGGDVSGAIDGLARGGVRVIEVTADTPGAWAAIEAAAARPGLVIGAGTVTEPAQVRQLAAAGGQFAVSPGFDSDVVAAALDAGLGVLPGVATGTEVLAARRAGAQLLKLFPAASLGIRYLAELRGPFRTQLFVPTGGITAAGLGEWLAAGAFAVALGSELAGRVAPAGDSDIAAIAGRAQAALEHARAAGGSG